MTEQKRFRCAVYTRKSSEEGLEQDFNSLEAQREAGEAYVRSQAHEGWKLIPDRFDDGGFSGGNMDRPALGRLMQMIREGQVDVIVIYKIDRLTRSLTDFARLAETFDKHGVSFVSVTQQFNTTTSMGRLMLNVLLSFAQFEREITGERIRDKIAASKKKGMWMGGPIPMGYDVKDRQLIVNEDGANAIRRIFELYLDESSVPALLERLGRERIRTTSRTSAKGTTSGGQPFTRGHLYKLLSNPLYIGEISHKGKMHRGQHQAIIGRELWDGVQAKLADNTQGERTRRQRTARSEPLLAGILYSEAGHRMIPMHATKAGRRYTYYVEQFDEQVPDRDGAFDVVAGLLPPDDPPPFTGVNRRGPMRLPAPEIEATVVATIQQTLRDPAALMKCLGMVDASNLPHAIASAATVAHALDHGPSDVRTNQLAGRVIVSRRRLTTEICVAGLKSQLGLERCDIDSGQGATHRVEVALTFRKRGRQLKLSLDESKRSPAAKVDETLLVAIARAFDWFERLCSGEIGSVTALATEDGFDAGYVSHLLPLAFLSPDETEAIASGRQPAEVTADRMIWGEEIPRRWPMHAGG